jgi:hypothetical protein
VCAAIAMAYCPMKTTARQAPRARATAVACRVESRIGRSY